MIRLTCLGNVLFRRRVKIVFSSPGCSAYYSHWDVWERMGLLQRLSRNLVQKKYSPAEAHLVRATTERSFYRTAVNECKTVVRHHFTHDGTFSPPPVGAALTPGSGPTRVHYSFDFAQQVHYPHNPLQPGPMYFKTARKCAVFGVCCEALPRQVNYLIRRGIRHGEGCQHCHQSAASLPREPCSGRE